MVLKIRRERLKRDWACGYVVQQIKTTPTTIQKIERGQHKPSYDVLVKLLYLFGYKKEAQKVEHILAVVDGAPNLSNKE